MNERKKAPKPSEVLQRFIAKLSESMNCSKVNEMAQGLEKIF